MSQPAQRFSRIFAVIDPTRFVQTAFLRAESIASRSGAEVTAYCCIDEVSSEGTHSGTEERLEAMRASIQRLADSSSVERIQIQVESSHNWRRSLVDAAIGSDCDLVLKQASQHSLVGRVFSATADWMLLSEARQPVLLVAERTPGADRSVLAAIKLKADDAVHESLNEKIVELSHYLSKVVGFEMHAATAFRGDDVYFDRQHFADFCGLPRNRVHAEEGAAHMAIARVAQQIGADTIVIGNPEKSETAQRLIDHVTCDMLVLPAAA